MILKLAIVGAVLEVLCLVMLLTRNGTLISIGQIGFYIGVTISFVAAGISGVGLLMTLGAGDQGQYFLRSFGWSAAAVVLALVTFNFVIGAESRARTLPSKRKGNKQAGKLPETIAVALIFLAIALLIKTASNVLNLLIGWHVALPIEWFDFMTTVFMILYLIACAMVLTPVGFIVFAVIGAMSCLAVYLVIWSVGVFIAGAILSLIAGIVFSGVIIVGTMSLGVFIPQYAIFVSYVPLAIPAAGAAPLIGLGAAAGGLATAGAAAGRRGPGANRTLHRIINVALIFLVGIPVLSAATGISGVFRCKPAHIFGIRMFNRFNLITADSGLKRSSYKGDLDVFIGDNYNCLQTTEEFNAEADSNTTAILHGDVLHVYDSETMEVLGQEACPIPNSRDTVLIMNSLETYVLGDEELFIVNYEGRVRHYFISDYPWRKEYLRMTEEEQMDHIYHLLMEEYDPEHLAPLQQAAVVKLSAQHGQLVHYDLEKKTVIFASPQTDGTVTFYMQTAPGERKEMATVEAHPSSGRIPYFWDISENGINILNDDAHMSMLYANGELWGPYEPFQGREILSCNHAYTVNGESCNFLLTPEILYAYMFDRQQWVDMDLDPKTTENFSGVLQAGNRITYYHYPKEDLLRRFTYLRDIGDMEGSSFKRKYIESHYHGLQYVYRDLDETFGASDQ